jgi:hypothetical protein
MPSIVGFYCLFSLFYEKELYLQGNLDDIQTSSRINMQFRSPHTLYCIQRSRILATATTDRLLYPTQKHV